MHNDVFTLILWDQSYDLVMLMALDHFRHSIFAISHTYMYVCIYVYMFIKSASVLWIFVLLNEKATANLITLELDLQ